jgi:hypothetical protein
MRPNDVEKIGFSKFLSVFFKHVFYSIQSIPITYFNKKHQLSEYISKVPRFLSQTSNQINNKQAKLFLMEI